MDGLTLRDADALQAKVSTWYQNSFTPGRRRLVNDHVLKSFALVATIDDDHDVTKSNDPQNSDPNPDNQHHYSLFWGKVQPSWELLRLLLSLSP